MRVREILINTRLTILIACYFTLSSNIYSQIDTFNISPSNQNIDTTILAELQSEINNNQYGELHSLLVVRNGKLVFEEYYNDFTQDDLHPLYSVTKTFTSALIGIAIDQGLINSVDDYLLDYFPEYYNPTYEDSLKQTIQIKHLLTMTGGFANEDGIYESDDYLEFMLNLPMASTPGKVWKYSGGTTMLLSGLIQNATGLSAEDFAATNLFNPLNITDWYWNTGPNNLTGAAGGLNLRPFDMAQFGQLYLQEGLWNGNQIISKEWINESSQVYVPSSSGDRSYGYHLYQYVDASGIVEVLDKNDIYFASGAKVQKIYVIPHLDCVVVITSENADFRPLLKKLISSIHINLSSNVKEDTSGINRNFDSLEGSPNPFDKSTRIHYTLNQSNSVTLKVYNSVGQEIATLVNGFQNAGKHEVVWNSNDLPSGSYFCELCINNYKETQTLLLRKK